MAKLTGVLVLYAENVQKLLSFVDALIKARQGFQTVEITQLGEEGGQH